MLVSYASYEWLDRHHLEPPHREAAAIDAHLRSAPKDELKNDHPRVQLMLAA